MVSIVSHPRIYVHSCAAAELISAFRMHSKSCFPTNIPSLPRTRTPRCATCAAWTRPPCWACCGRRWRAGTRWKQVRWAVLPLQGFGGEQEGARGVHAVSCPPCWACCGRLFPDGTRWRQGGALPQSWLNLQEHKWRWDSDEFWTPFLLANLPPQTWPRCAPTTPASWRLAAHYAIKL